MTNKESANLFFDFYCLSMLNFFGGSHTLNHGNKGKRITESYEAKVEEIYQAVRRELEYAVAREFRHFSQYAYYKYNRAMPSDIQDKQLRKSLRKACDVSESLDGRMTCLLDDAYILMCSYDGPRSSRPYYRYLNASMRQKYSEFFNSCKDDIPDLWFLVLQAFEYDDWVRGYGGELWAEATRFVLDTPKTIANKELWVDRVFDLHHNSGHLLNKTGFKYISKRNQFRRRGQTSHYARTALNFRRYAKTISELAEFSSGSVKKLVKANLNQLPAAIR